MRWVLPLGFLLLTTLPLYAQSDGIGGVLLRDVVVNDDDEDLPRILPAGGLVAFGANNDWASAYRKNGAVRVVFLVLNKKGKPEDENLLIPEDAVRVFNWACGEPMANPFDKRRPIRCYPFNSPGFLSEASWQLRFVTEARRVAQELGLPVVERFRLDYTGRPKPEVPITSQPEVPAVPPPDGRPAKCTLDQILKMKEAGLSDEQVKAACGGGHCCPTNVHASSRESWVC